MPKGYDLEMSQRLDGFKGWWLSVSFVGYGKRPGKSTSVFYCMVSPSERLNRERSWWSQSVLTTHTKLENMKFSLNVPISLKVNLNLHKISIIQV